MHKKIPTFYTWIFTINVSLLQVLAIKDFLTTQKCAEESDLKFSPELDKIFWGSELDSNDYFCLVKNRERNTFKYPRGEVNHLVYEVNLENSTFGGGSSGQSVAGTEDPFVHPLAGLLVLRRFNEFKATLEEALRLFLDTGQELPSKLHYELFVFSSFYPIKKVFKCIPISGQDNRRACQHVLIPILGKGDYAFVIKYVMSPQIALVQSSAEEGLRQMLKVRIDKAILRSNPHVKYVFNVCVSFFNARVGLAHTEEECNKEESK